MEFTTSRKRARVDEFEDEADYNPRYRPPPFCPDCGARSHPGNCWPRCHRCDRRHIGVCTAFCRKCADIGHSWRHCRLYIPNHIWRREHCGLLTTIQNVNITVPVIDPGPIFTPISLNATILSRLDIALHGLHRKAGVPNHSRVMLNNVNITTNILAAEREAPLAPDTSLLDRVQRIPTGPRSNIPNTRRPPTKSAPTKPTFAQSAFARSAFSQPVSGQTAFAQGTSLLDRVQRIPTGPRSNIPNTRPAPMKPTFAQSAFAPSAFSQPVFGQTAFTQDTSLLDRVQRIPTGPRSTIPSTRPAPTKPPPTKPTFAQSAFAPSAFSQPMFGQTAFAQPTFIQNNSVDMTPTWPRHT